MATWLFVFAAAGTAKVPEDNKNIGICGCLTILPQISDQLISAVISDDCMRLSFHPWLLNDVGSVCHSLKFG